MKKKFTIIALIVLYTISYSQSKAIQEKIIVLNIEVPVRVLYKGELVNNLKKSDFRLFENNKEMKINGFNIIRKKISSQNIALDSSSKEFIEPRLFVLVFNLVEYNNHIKAGLEYFFKNILNNNDKLLVLANNKLLKFDDLEEKWKIFQIIINNVKQEGLLAKGILLKYMKDVKMVIPFAVESDFINLAPLTALNFLNRYLNYLKEYKFRYLHTDMGVYYNFSKFLEEISIKKWVINFYQFQMFPKMKTASILQEVEKTISKARESTNPIENSYSRLIEKKLKEVYMERNFENTFPTEEISKLFYKVNTTFFTVFIPTTIESFEKDMDYGRIATALENNLKEITKNTGGTLIRTLDLKDALEKFTTTEDTIYMLTYVPEENRKSGALKVVINRKNHVPLYDNNIRADYISDYLERRAERERIIQIKNISFENKSLNFDLSNYKTDKTNNKETGNIFINIVIKNENDQKLYDKSKDIITGENKVNVSVSFDWISEGDYDLLVDIKDKLTGKTAFEYIKIKVK